MAKQKNTSEAAKALSKLGASKGGIARAESLPAEERREIARRAAEARWAKREDAGSRRPILRATHGSEDHPLRILNITIPCYVLEGDIRVITNRGIQRSLGMAESGGAQRLADLMDRFRAKGIDVKDLPARIMSPLEFRPTRGGRSAYGYEATVLADICDVILAARQAGVLGKQYERLAEHCEILIRGFARVGIIALVDEATGFQYDRARKALEDILERFISTELVKWAKIFPDEFYSEMFRLRGWAYPPSSSKRPMLVGKLTIDLVYERLAPGVLQELRRLTPRDERGRLKHKLFQRLTEDIGHPRLREHLEAVKGIMKGCEDGDWTDFYKRLNRAYPKYQDMPLFDRKPTDEIALQG